MEHVLIVEWEHIIDLSYFVIIIIIIIYEYFYEYYY